MGPHHTAPGSDSRYAEITSVFVINIISLLSQESIGPTPLLTHTFHSLHKRKNNYNCFILGEAYRQIIFVNQF